MQRAEVESTVEAVGQRRQVSSGVVSEVDCMIAIGQASVEIAQDLVLRLPRTVEIHRNSGKSFGFRPATTVG